MTPAPRTTLSVALCTCEGEDRHLGEQLASIAAQHRRPDEVVVCDDASRDATCEIVHRFADEAPFPVSLRRHETRLGASANFASAIARCTGDVIVLCDQDDVWSPAKLQRMSEAFAIGAPGLVFSDADLVDGSLRPLGTTLYEVQGIDARFRSRLAADPLAQLIGLRRAPLGLTLAFSASLRPLVLPLPPYREQLIAHDAWIDLVAASIAPLVGLDERLVAYRQHAGQLVGARLRRPPRAPLRERLREHPDRAIARAIAGELLARLERWTPPPGPAAADWSRRAQRSRALLADRLRHLRARDELAAGLAPRSRTVARELGARRYHRHSGGLVSATKDLLAPPRQRS